MIASVGAIGGADGPTKIFVSGSVWPIVFTAALVALIVFLLMRKK